MTPPTITRPAATLSELLDRFAGLRAVVVGDVMLDEYLVGEVTRVSPEAPVPVVALRERTRKPGGAANVALNVASLGASVALVGLVADDEAGGQLREALRREGIADTHLVTTAHRPTTRKARVISQGQHLLRVDSEDSAASRADESDAVAAAVLGLIGGGEAPDVVIFEDYDKGTLDAASIARIVAAARGRGIRTVVDPKARNFFAYRGVDLFKPNLKEVREALPQMRVDAADVPSLARTHAALVERLAHGTSLITLGAAGAFVAEGASTRLERPRPREIVDVCGAGDAVVATSALALAAGASARQVLELANLAGGLACEWVGVRPVGMGALREGVVRDPA